MMTLTSLGAMMTHWSTELSAPLTAAHSPPHAGKTKLYDTIEERGWPYLVLSIVAFMFWNDFAIYWVHRWLHKPMFYRRVVPPTRQ